MSANGTELFSFIVPVPGIYVPGVSFLCYTRRLLQVLYVYLARSIVEKGAYIKEEYILSEQFNDAPAGRPAFIIISVLLIMSEPRKLPLSLSTKAPPRGRF